MTSDLTEEEREFIAAVIEDQNYELDVGSEGEYSLLTDWEGDGGFYPSVTILHSVSEDDVEREEEHIAELLEQYDWLSFDSVEVEEGESVGHAYLPYASVDEDTLESVRESYDS